MFSSIWHYIGSGILGVLIAVHLVAPVPTNQQVIVEKNNIPVQTETTPATTALPQAKKQPQTVPNPKLPVKDNNSAIRTDVVLPPVTPVASPIISAPANGSCASGTTFDKSANECVTTLAYCQNRNGSNATYNSVDNSCGCASGYALNSNNICSVQKTGYQVCSEAFPNETWDGTYASNGKYNCVCQAGYTWNNSGAYCQLPQQQSTQNVQANTATIAQINALQQQILDVKTKYYQDVQSVSGIGGDAALANGRINRLTNDANQKIDQLNLQIQQLELNAGVRN